MKQLNTRRAQLLKTEKIAVLNEVGTVEELDAILNEAFPVDRYTFNSKLSTMYFYSEKGVYFSPSDALPDGYTAHPISWFFEADEAEKPTFEELKAMSLEDRIEALKKMGYVDGVMYKSHVNGRDESFIIDTKRLSFGRISTYNKSIDGGEQGDWLMWDGKWAEIISKPDEAPKPEAEIIGWELMIDVPEWNQKAGKSFRNAGVGKWSFSVIILPESILRDMKSARPIYKRTTEDILNAVKQGTMSVEDAVKELEQTKTA